MTNSEMQNDLVVFRDELDDSIDLISTLICETFLKDLNLFSDDDLVVAEDDQPKRK